jgi:hypothetical protein
LVILDICLYRESRSARLHFFPTSICTARRWRRAVQGGLCPTHAKVPGQHDVSRLSVVANPVQRKRGGNHSFIVPPGLRRSLLPSKKSQPTLCIIKFPPSDSTAESFRKPV